MLAMRACFCGLPCLGATLLILGAGSPARSERLPLPALLQARVNHAIDRGVGFLMTTEGPWGTWTADPKNHPVGYAALPGLTLLECGEARDHPGILMAASFVRQGCAKLDNTYDLSLAILFLIRQAEPNGLARLGRALLAFLVLVQILLLPVNYGILIMDKSFARVASVANEPLADGDAAWLVWEGKEGVTFLVRRGNQRRVLLTVPRADVKRMEIVGFDPIVPTLFGGG